MDEKHLIKSLTKLCVSSFVAKAASTFALIFSVAVYFSFGFKENFANLFLSFSGLMVFLSFFQIFKPIRQFRKATFIAFSAGSGFLMLFASENLNQIAPDLALIMILTVVYFNFLSTSFFMERFNSIFKIKEQKRFYYIFNGSHFMGAILAGVSIPFLFELATIQTSLRLAAFSCWVVPFLTFLVPKKISEPTQVSRFTKIGQTLKSFKNSQIGFWWFVVAILASLTYGFSIIPFLLNCFSQVTSTTEIAILAGKIVAGAEILIFLTFALILPVFLPRFSPPSLLLFAPLISILGGSLSIFFPDDQVKFSAIFVIYISLRTFNLTIFQSFVQLFKDVEKPQIKILHSEVFFALGLLPSSTLFYFYPDFAFGNKPMGVLILIGVFSAIVVLAGRKNYFQAVRVTLDKSLKEDFADELVGNSSLNYFSEKKKIMSLPSMHRSGAILRLAQNCPKSAAKITLELLDLESDEKVKSTLVRTCGRLKGVQIKEKLIEIISNSTLERLSADALESLFQIDKDIALSKALEALKSENNRLKANAILVCLRSSNNESELKLALETLKEMVLSSKPEYRASACAIVGEIKSRAAIPAIKKLLSDTNELVLKAAIKAASKIRNPELEECLKNVAETSEELKSYVAKQLKLNASGLGKSIARLIQTDGQITMEQVTFLMGRLRNEDEVEIAYQVAMRFPGMPGYKILEQLSFHSKPGLIQKLEKSLVPFGLDFEKIWQMVKEENNLEVNELGIACLGAVDEETFKNVVRRAIKDKAGAEAKKNIFAGAGMRIGDPNLGIGVWENFNSGENLLFDKGNQLIQELDQERARELFHWLKKQLI